MKSVKSVIKELAEQLNLSDHEVEMVIRSEFKLVLSEAQKKTHSPVRLIFIGVFGVKPAREEFMKKLSKIDTNIKK